MEAQGAQGIWTVISQVGFPIFACVALMWIIERRLIKITVLLSLLVDRVKPGASAKEEDE